MAVHITKYMHTYILGSKLQSFRIAATGAYNDRRVLECPCKTVDELQSATFVCIVG
jgi:hypothetical protein